MNAFKQYAAQFITLMDDIDRLLATRKDFLLGNWLAAARANGVTLQEKNLYEFNARDLITLWGDKNCTLHDYSTRQWAGVISGFYKPRWELFFKTVENAMAGGREADFKAFDKAVEQLEWQWVNQHEGAYATAPQGDAVVTALQLYGQYSPVINAAYQNGMQATQ